MPFPYYSEYTALGGSLFPCRIRKTGDPSSKAPRIANYQSIKVSKSTIHQSHDREQSIGWVIPDCTIVLDVDAVGAHQADGLGAFDQLQRDLGITFGEPSTVSPNGGSHYYLRLPETTERRRLRGKLEMYPGIDIKLPGQYVIAAGSVHWQGGEYDTGIFGVQVEDCPEELLPLLTRPVQELSESAQSGKLSSYQLQLLLSLIPVDNMGHEDWLQIAMSAHHATGGEGLDAFRAWCWADPKYLGDMTVETRWASFNKEYEGGFTVGTILRAARHAITQIDEPKDRGEAAFRLSQVRAELEFDELLSESDIETESEYAALAENAAKPKPSIRLSSSNLRENVEALNEHIAAVCLAEEMFRFGKQVVSFRWNASWNTEGSMIAFDLGPDDIEEKLSGHIDFSSVQAKTDKKTGEIGWVETPKAPPQNLLRLVASGSPKLDNIPTVTRLVTAPQLMPDGSVLKERGLNDLGVMYCPSDPIDFELIEEPTKDDVAEAVETLLEVVQDFNFCHPSHKSAWVALLLTMLSRTAIKGAVPLFLVNGLEEGSGKTLLIRVAMLIAYGSMKPFNSSDRFRDEELHKYLLGAVRRGDEIVFYDNLQTGYRIHSAVLDSTLTGPQLTGRELGHNSSITGDNCFTFIVTGNDIGASGKGETSRRMIVTHLDSNKDRVDFHVPGGTDGLLAWAVEQRPKLLSAVFTILRGPKAESQPPAMNSFGLWDEVVRQPILAAGLEDPLKGLAEARSVIDEKSDMHEVVTKGMCDRMDAYYRTGGKRGRQIRLSSLRAFYPDDGELFSPDDPDIPTWDAAYEAIMKASDPRAINSKTGRETAVVQKLKEVALANRPCADGRQFHWNDKPRKWSLTGPEITEEKIDD